MLSLLLEPTMHILKTHMAMSGLSLDKSVFYESADLDPEDGVNKALKGDKSLLILYERQRIRKDSSSSKPITFVVEEEGGTPYKRKAIVATVPFNISIITNQLLDLDNFELLHRLELFNTSFKFTMNLPEDPEQRLEYLVSYSNPESKANNMLSDRALSKGFHKYDFTIEVQGYLLAPYTFLADIVTKVDFNMIFSSGANTVPDDGNSIRILIPDN